LSGKADYENRSKKRTQDFSRNRKTPFKKLIWFMLSLVKESSQNALERFFPKLNDHRLKAVGFVAAESLLKRPFAKAI
jgi:hypothetical protein